MTVTNQKIYAAADKLESAGEKPTLAAVRKVLGGGSFTTISESMRIWKTEKISKSSLPDIVVPEIVKEQVKKLELCIWKGAMAEAESMLETERKALTEVGAKINADLLEQKEAVSELELEAKEQESRFAGLFEEKSDLESRVQLLERSCVRLEEQIDAKSEIEKNLLGQLDDMNNILSQAINGK